MSTDLLPVAPAQEGLYFHALLDRDSADRYVVQCRFRLPADADAGALRAAVDTLLARHPNLRACFRHRGKHGAVQLVPGRVVVPWDEVDLRTVDDSGFAQSPLERLQNIGTVWIIASDRATPRLAMRGIPEPRALREKIRENAYRMSQGQVFTRST